VKLIRIEAESDALGDWLDERTEIRWITSALAEVELTRAIRAVAPEGLSAVPSVLARLDRFEIDSVIRSTAAAYPHPALRSLDAIHLATAQVAASTAPLTALVTYDGRLSNAAATLGITTAAPGKGVMKPAGEGTREIQSIGGNVMSNSTPAAGLAERARGAAWGLAKGGHLDTVADGKGVLLGRLGILEAAERAGIHIDLDEHGIGAIYTRAEIENLP
jgi:predicted nucleic acid-binding protein